VLDRKP